MSGGSSQAEVFRMVFLFYFFVLLTFRLAFDFFFFFAILPLILHVILYLYLSKSLVERMTQMGVWCSILIIVAAVGSFLCLEEGLSHDIFHHYWISLLGVGMWVWIMVFRYRSLVQEASRGGGFAHQVQLLQERLRGLNEEHRRLAAETRMHDALEGKQTIKIFLE